MPSPIDLWLIFHKFYTCHWVWFKHFPKRYLLFWIVVVGFGLKIVLSMSALSFACCRTLANLFFKLPCRRWLVQNLGHAHCTHFMEFDPNSWWKWEVFGGNPKIYLICSMAFSITGIDKWEERLFKIKRFSRYKRLLGIKTHSNE